MAVPAKLKLLDVVTALEPLTNEQTKNLVIHLGVELKTTVDIETDYRGSSRKLHSIQAWLDQDTEASWEKIVSGLEQIGMNVLARQVATQHCPQSLVPAIPSSDPHQPATVPTSQPTNTPAPPGTSSVATSHQPASGHTPQPEATLHPPQPTNTPAPPTPATPSPVATTPPVTDCDQSPNQPTSSTPATVPDQSNPPAYSQALALPPPSTSPATSNQPPHTSSSPAALALALPYTTNQTSTITFWSLDKVIATIRQLKDMFLDLTTDAEEEISQQDGPDKRFLRKFRKFIQLLPIARKPPHDRFFHQYRNEIVAAQNTDTLLAILCGYVDYRNYEIMLDIITGFCTAPLLESMQKYRVSLETFEMHTTVDVYISAVPDEMNEKRERGFSKMVFKIDKPASQCTLHEVRKVNETITVEAGLESHSVYISGVAENCVLVDVRFPSSAVGWVLSAMTPNFMTTHCLSEVTLDGQQLTLGTEELVCDITSCVVYNNIHLSTCAVYTMWSILSSKQPHCIHAYLYKHL